MPPGGEVGSGLGRFSAGARTARFRIAGGRRVSSDVASRFGDLPKTSTGKIQKFVLRDKEWAGLDKRTH
jgi:acyl-CoA synthetase (AMP-forming)/AMP-acid ligase II